MTTTTGRLTIEVVDVSGDVVSVEVTIRLDTVEFWSHERCRAVVDRERLRTWLALPDDILTVDDIALAGSPEFVEIMIDPLVMWWPLSEAGLADLRNRV